jgi:hypothetical protein
MGTCAGPADLWGSATAPGYLVFWVSVSQHEPWGVAASSPLPMASLLMTSIPGPSGCSWLPSPRLGMAYSVAQADPECLGLPTFLSPAFHHQGGHSRQERGDLCLAFVSTEWHVLVQGLAESPLGVTQPNKTTVACLPA